MFLSQLKTGGVICRQGDAARLVPGFASTYELAKAAIAAKAPLAAIIERQGAGDAVDLAALAAAGKLDCPVRHPDARAHVSHRHRPHPHRLRLGTRQHACRHRRHERLHEDVPHGHRRRQAEAG